MKRTHRRARMASEIKMLKRQLAQLTALTQQQAADAERRYTLIDQFIDPSMELHGLLVQLRESQQRIIEVLRDLPTKLAQDPAAPPAAVTPRPRRKQAA